MRSKIKNIVILTGAGISAESGIPTFRDSNGLWENYDVMEVATPQGYAKNPDLVNRFYDERRAQLKTVEPNAAHIALTKLRNEYKGDVTLITQNGDDLHERAGYPDAFHMHGDFLKVYCTTSHQVFTIDGDTPKECECCGTNTLRPHVVWFDEEPLGLNQIEGLLMVCDLYLTIGTSGVVMPAAGFVNKANRAGATTVQILLEEGPNVQYFDHTIIGKATETVPRIVDAILTDQFQQIADE